MCYIRIDIKEGFFYKNELGYKVNFQLKEVEEFPFDLDMEPV